MVPEKLLSYNRANRAVAILCNHQRAPPKTFDQSMANLQAKVGGSHAKNLVTIDDTDDDYKFFKHLVLFSTQIVARKEQLSLAKTELKQAKKEVKEKGSADAKLQTYVFE